MPESARSPEEPGGSLTALVEAAVAVHQRGDLELAASLYADILAHDPNQFTVLHLLGTLHNQRGEHQEAARCLEGALKLNPRSAYAHLNLGIALWNLERPEESLSHYQLSLLLNPNQPDGLLRYAFALQTLNRTREALDSWNRLLGLVPDHAVALLNRGMTLQDLHRGAEARASFDQALALDPGLDEALMDRARDLRQAIRLEDARSTLQLILDLQSENTAALLALGGVLLNLGRPAEALPVLDALVGLCPDSAEAFLDRGNALMGLGRHADALASYERVLELAPDHVDGLMNRGTALLELDRTQDALAAYERVLAIRPDWPGIHLNRGNALLRLGRPQEALSCFEKSLLDRPDDPRALLNRANALLALKRPAEALASCDRALLLQPDCVDALVNRGTALLDLKRAEEALAAFDRALALQPDYPNLLMNHGTALHLLARHREAIASYDKALALDPDHARAHSNKIYLLDFLPDVGFLEHQLERQAYANAHARRFATREKPFANDRSRDRRLVLGYVSADFMHHSAASCFMPVLARHSRTGFQVNCYSGVQVEDEWTHRFRTSADVWRSVGGLSDDDLARQIQDDRVDILVDLSGHSKGNRLLVFARRPAPIQVTAWGHGGGTGIPAVDYQFTDPVSIPLQVRPYFAEKAWDLPCCVTFEAPSFAPPIRDLPARSRGVVIFGSLNRYTKVTPAVERLWSRILHAVPGSRLLLKDGRFDDPEGREAVLARFAGLGIDRERIELRGFTSHEDHLAACGEVDIVLDSFPQNGGITTWEALWMGAPVIAMLGNKLASRISGAILHSLGLGDWVAQDEEEYLRIAIQRAADLESLAVFREDIRPRILASPSGNPEKYTRLVEEGYRAMWVNWLDT